MSDYFDRIERQLVRSVEARQPRRMRWPASLMPVAAALVVVVVVGVFLGIRGRSHPPAGTDAGGGVVFVSSAPPAEVAQAARILRLRLGVVFSDVHVTRVGHEIVASAAGASRAQIEALAAPGRLSMYDWEASTLTPGGRTVASQLRAQSPAALEISQGSGGGPPGSESGGGLPLRDAISLARRVERTSGGRTQNRVVVLEAVAPSYGRGRALSEPAARFFVLRATAALTGNEITGPHAGRDGSGQPDVQFGFTAAGARAFHSITAAVARRGALVSGPGLILNQHFAIALDNRLLTVPSIDFRAYPDGIPGGDGADINAGFTTRSARELAALLRYGPLPVNLRAQSG